jgi:hypothetical protein
MVVLTGLAIDYRKTEAEQGMLLNLHKRGWTEGLKLRNFEELKEGNEKAVKVGSPLNPERELRLTFCRKCCHSRRHIPNRSGKRPPSPPTSSRHGMLASWTQKDTSRRRWRRPWEIR